MNIYKGNLVKLKTIKWFQKNINNSRNVEINYGYCSFTKEMSKFCSNILRVHKVNNEIVSLISLVSNNIVGDFPIDSIERIVSPTELLKPGYIVETEEKASRLIVSVLYNDNLYLISKFSLINLNDFDKKDDIIDSIGINKIYQAKKEVSIGNLSELGEKDLNLIWKKPRKLVLTKEEIANKFEIDPNDLIIK